MGKVFKKKRIQTWVVDDVLCDICGKSTKQVLAKDIEQLEYSHLGAVWGYTSNWDGDCWDYYFCGECSKGIKEWMKGKNVPE